MPVPGLLGFGDGSFERVAGVTTRPFCQSEMSALLLFVRILGQNVLLF
jgi:hypothetical protein